MDSFDKADTPTPPTTPMMDRSEKTNITKPKTSPTKSEIKFEEKLDNKVILPTDEKEVKSKSSSSLEVYKGKEPAVTLSPEKDKEKGSLLLASKVASLKSDLDAAETKTKDSPETVQKSSAHKVELISGNETKNEKKDSPETVQRSSPHKAELISGHETKTKDSPETVQRSSPHKVELISGNKKDSPVAIVAPTVKSASTTAIRDVPAARQGSNSMTVLAGGLASGARARFRSPPYRDDR